jgi:hypothetical protein
MMDRFLRKKAPQFTKVETRLFYVYEYVKGRWRKRGESPSLDQLWATYNKTYSDSVHPVAVVSIENFLQVCIRKKKARQLLYCRDTSPDMLAELLRDKKAPPVQQLAMDELSDDYMQGLSDFRQV